MITDYEKIKKNIANVREQVNQLSGRQRDIAIDVMDELEILIGRNSSEEDIRPLLSKFDEVSGWCEDAVLWNAF